MGMTRHRRALPSDLPWDGRPVPAELEGQRSVDELLAQAGNATVAQILEDYARPPLPYPWSPAEHPADS